MTMTMTMTMIVIIIISLRNLSTNFFAHSLFHLLILAYCIVYPSLLNILLHLLQVIDILFIQTLPEFAREKERNSDYRRKQTPTVQGPNGTESHYRLLSHMSEPLNHSEHVLLHGDKNSHTWMRLYPAIWVRKAIFSFFAMILLLRLFFAVWGRRDWERLPVLLCQIIYAINGGESAYSMIMFEYVVMVFIAFMNMVRVWLGLMM